MRERYRSCAAALLVALAGGAPASIASGPRAADGAPTPFPPGQVVERVACEGDPTQTYALYLPSAYTPETRWPVLVAMDPRGRALAPLELFREAAERRGFILASSYDTLSDGPREPNARAVNAMVPDLARRFSIDPKRWYFTGFSGTARVAWDIGASIPDAVAGLIGFGGGLPAGGAPPTDAPFVFFGAAGTRDFNHEEMRRLDARLETVGMPHRFAPFDGAHQWGPTSVAARAIDWMQLMAMKRGLTSRDASFESALWEAGMQEARILEAEDDPYEAWRAWEALAADFEGLRDVGPARVRAGQLAASKGVKKIVRRRERIVARQVDFEGRLYDLVERFRGEHPPSAAHAAIDLQIKALQRQAAGNEPLEALAAERLLELAFTNLVFYEPRDLLAKGDFEAALVVIEVADRIKPDHPQVCMHRARARARLNRTEAALDDVACVADSGWATADRLEADPHLESLRADPRFRAILARLRAAASPTADPPE